MKHTTHDMLEQYSFYWSELRLVIAALALFLGGIPPVYYFFGPSGFSGILNLCWIISGLASAYLLLRWSKVKTLFGKKDNMDLAAFFVMVVSGINLGLAGLIGRNIGMSISYNRFIFVIVGILYLASAYHLQKRWKANGRKIF